MDTKLVLAWIDQRLHELSGAAVIAAGVAASLDKEQLVALLGTKAGIAIALVGAYQVYKARMSAPATPVSQPESKP